MLFLNNVVSHFHKFDTTGVLIDNKCAVKV